MDKTQQSSLEAYFRSKGHSDLRPIATSLNGDNSWLLSFPQPQDERAATGRSYYHVVFEPWLAGPAGFLSSWVIHINLPAQPAVPDVKAINKVAGDVEDLAAKHVVPGFEAKPRVGEQGNLDAILLTFHYDDHLHKPTLLLFDKKIPVFATPQAAAVVNPWRHFDTVRLLQDMPPNAETWRATSLHPGNPMPSWLTCLRFPGPSHELNFAWAIVWTHHADQQQDMGGQAEGQVHEAILGSPHGMPPDQEPYGVFSRASPPTKKLAMMHGLKESFAAGFQNTFGVKAGLAMNRKLGGVGSWLVSHDALLGYSGILMRMLYVHDVSRTSAWAVEEEAKRSKEGESTTPVPKFLEVDNGASVVLE
jgi:hypothetical protein